MFLGAAFWWNSGRCRYFRTFPCIPWLGQRGFLAAEGDSWKVCSSRIILSSESSVSICDRAVSASSPAIAAPTPSRQGAWLSVRLDSCADSCLCFAWQQAGTLSSLQLEPMVCRLLHPWFFFLHLLFSNLKNPADWYDLFVLIDSSTFVVFNRRNSANWYDLLLLIELHQIDRSGMFYSEFTQIYLLPWDTCWFSARSEFWTTKPAALRMW